MEAEAKGFFADAVMLLEEKRYRLTFFYPARSNQEIQAQFKSEVVFCELNLVVVCSVTRANMEAAVNMLARSGHTLALVPD